MAWMARLPGPALLHSSLHNMHCAQSKTPPSQAPQAAAAPRHAPLLGHIGSCDNQKPEKGLDQGRGCRTGRCWAQNDCVAAPGLLLTGCRPLQAAPGAINWGGDRRGGPARPPPMRARLTLGHQARNRRSGALGSTPSA